MWISKKNYEYDKIIRGLQEDLIKNKDKETEVQDSLIETLGKEISVYKDFVESFKQHCKELSGICDRVVDDNEKLINHINVLENKNKILQASLDEAMRQIKEKENEENARS